MFSSAKISFDIIWISWLASEILLSRLMRAEKTDNNLDKSSLKILWISISTAVTAGVFLKNSGPVLTIHYYMPLYYCGIILIVGGVLLRGSAILKLKKSFTVNVAVAQGQKLVNSGIYKYIRHPAYTGSLLSFAGLAIVFNHWLTMLVIFIPIFLAFYYRIHVEEQALLQAFGEQYARYIKNSRKLLPFIF